MAKGKKFPFYNRLAFRITCGVIALLLAVGIAFSYRIARFHREQMLSSLQKSTTRLSGMVVSVLENAMLERKFDLLGEMVEGLKKEEGVERILILNKRGEIKISDDAGLLGQVLDRQSPTCAICHRFTPESRGRTVIFNTEAGEEVFRNVTPIFNKPKCYRCHDRQDKINGVLIMDFSTAEAKSLLASDSRIMALLIATMIAGMVIAISLLMTRLITRRVRNLERMAQTIEEGDLDQSIEEAGNDEIGSLAAHFNAMAASLKNYIEDSRKQRAYLENLINSVGDGIMVIDKSFGVVMANKACVSLFGYTLEEIHGNLCYLVSHGRTTPCDDPLNPCPVSQTFSSGRHFKAVHTCYHRSGEEKHIEIHSSPLRDENGETFQVIEVLRDITERKQLEAQLSHSERLTSLGILASGISHEINNPLASIATFLEGLKKRLEEGGDSGKAEDLPHYLDLMVREIKKCKTIIGKLLLLSRKSEFKRDFVDLNESLEETLSLVAFEADGREVEIKKRLCTPPPLIQGDETQIRQLFLNMTLNALQAMDGGGTLTVSSHVDGNRVSVVFEDTGKGIKREHLGKILDPFFTTKAKGQGTGLGLTICHNIVRQHEGQIRIESVEGKGSKFQITFPTSLNPLKSMD